MGRGCGGVGEGREGRRFGLIACTCRGCSRVKLSLSIRMKSCLRTLHLKLAGLSSAFDCSATAINGNQRQSTAIDGNQRQSTAIDGNRRQSKVLQGNPGADIMWHMEWRGCSAGQGMYRGYDGGMRRAPKCGMGYKI